MKFFFMLAVLKVFSALAALNESMSKEREARVSLKATVLAHRAVQGKVCPTHNQTALRLDFYFKAYEVLASDDLEQSFSTVSYLEVVWDDPDIAWNPTDYQGIKVLNLPFDELWHPSIVVINSADHELVLVKPTNNQVMVFHNGLILLRTPLFLKTTCVLDLTIYPFDSQECEIFFMPFIDECNFQVNTHTLDGYPDPFLLKGEWDIVDQNITTFTYKPGGDELPIAKANLKIVRSFLFYVITVISPMLLTSLMTSFVFLIPPDSGEKVSFLVSIFVSNAVFLNFIAGAIPRSMTVQNIPRLTLFLVAVMVESFFALLATMFVISRYRTEEKDKAKKYEDVLFQQMAEMLKPASRTDNPERNKSEKEIFLSKSNEDFKTTNLTTGSSKVTAQEAMFFLMQRTQLSAKRLKKFMAKHYGTKIFVRRSCCIRARHWDMIFFVIFTITSIPFYIALIFFPNPANPSLSKLFIN